MAVLHQLVDVAITANLVSRLVTLNDLQVRYVNIKYRIRRCDLSALKELLTSGSATGSDIGQVLVQLGSQTTSTASGADASISSQLQQLGQLLNEAGNSLLRTRTNEAGSQGSLGSEI